MAGEGEGRGEGGEGTSEKEDFSEFVEYLKEKYGEGGGVKNAENAPLKQDELEVGAQEVPDAAGERTEPDEFGSYVEYLRRRYESEGESKPEGSTFEANVKTDGDTDGRAEGSSARDVRQGIAEERQPAEPANTSKVEGDTKAEEAPIPRQDRAPRGPEVGAYQREQNDDLLEQQSARSETKREGVSESPEGANDSPEAASPARVGLSPKLGEVREEGEPKRVDQADVEGRAQNSEAVEGRAEAPQAHESVALKTGEGRSRPERGVTTAAVVGADQRQAYPERSATPSRSSDPGSQVEPKETQGSVEPAEGVAVFSATALRRTDDSTAFEVHLDSLREARVTFEAEKTYEIKGRIGEVCDFRKMYSPGESYRMAILAPKEYARSITPGEKYDVRIASVKEISRNEEHLGVFSATAYGMPGKEDLMRFDLLVSSFEKRTGVRFEEGKMYEVRGRIGDVCDFKVTRSAERSQHLFVFAPREYARDLTPGQKYDLTVESVREKRECHVTEGTGGFPRLTVQKRALEAAGLRFDGADKEGKIVAELNLKGSEGVTHRLFAKLEPSVSAVVMSMDKIGAKVGDVFDLQRARNYSDGVFIEDFNKNRSRELSNVRLQLEGKKLNMFVDDARFEISEYHLDAHRLQALLRCNLEPFKREIRFWFDGKEATAKFGGSWRIQSFSASEKGMSMTYEMGRGQITTWTDSRALEERKLGVEEIREKIELLATNNQTNDQTVVFKADQSLYSFVYGRFTDAINRSRGTYMRERGSISEDLCVAALPKAWWEEVKRYPRAGGEDNHGPDSLMRNKETGELFIFEFKWWDDVEKAAKNATQQVEDYFFENPTYHGEKIKGACIGILDWNLKSNTGKLNVKRVC